MDSSDDDIVELQKARAGKRHEDIGDGSRTTGKTPRKYPPREHTSYQYDPLRSGQGTIRILELFSSELSDAGVLCALVTPNEQETHQYPYEALSWCWGTAQKTCYIKIHHNGKMYAKYVSPNLIAALKALRYPHRSRYLWIDMVCIDQDKYVRTPYSMTPC